MTQEALRPRKKGEKGMVGEIIDFAVQVANEHLVPADLPERLFAELDRQLEAKGPFVKSGTLIDASLIEADVKRPPQAEGEVAERDPDAGFTRLGSGASSGTRRIWPSIRGRI